MEIKKWSPRPGQVWAYRQAGHARNFMISLLRRNDFVGFLAWVVSKMFIWLFWAGPVLFLAILISIPLFIIGALVISPAWLFARILYFFSAAPVDYVRRARIFLMQILEEYTEVILYWAFLPDSKLESVASF